MAFTFIAAVGGANDTAGTTLDASGSLNVAAGDLLVAWCKHEGANTTFAVAKTTGGNDFTFDAGDEINHTNNDLHGSMGYLLSASADATFTPRMTTGASVAYRALIVMQFRPDSGETVAKDGSNESEGFFTPANSGDITTTGTDVVVVGGFGPYGAVTTSAEQINGVSATEPTGSPQNYTSAWYSIVTSTFTGAATATISNVDYIAAVIAFKSTSAGATEALSGSASTSGVGTASPGISVGI